MSIVLHFQNFEGNHDSNSIRLNHVAFPVKANSVIFMPMSFHGNVAFRLELYGCESGQSYTIASLKRVVMFLFHSQTKLQLSHSNKQTHAFVNAGKFEI